MMEGVEHNAQVSNLNFVSSETTQAKRRIAEDSLSLEAQQTIKELRSQMQCSKCGEFGHTSSSEIHGERILSEEEKKTVQKKNNIIATKISVFKAKSFNPHVIQGYSSCS